MAALLIWVRLDDHILRHASTHHLPRQFDDTHAKPGADHPEYDMEATSAIIGIIIVLILQALINAALFYLL